MHPGRIANANVTYTEPEGWDRSKHGVCWAIHAKRTPVGNGHHITTAWFPTLQELHAMYNGAPVYLTLCTSTQPATKLEVGKPAENHTPLPRAINVTRSMLGNRAVTVVFETPPTEDQIALLKQHLSGAAK